MPRYVLRPNADAKADWTEVPAGAAWSALDEAVEQPTAATTTDRIETATNAAVCELDFTTQVITGERPVALTLWVYAKAVAGRQISASVESSASGFVGEGEGVTISDTAYGWHRVAVKGEFSQLHVHGLQARLVANTGTGTVEVAAAYIELITTTTEVASYARKLVQVAQTTEPDLYWIVGETADPVLDHSGNARHGDFTAPASIEKGLSGLIEGGRYAEFSNAVVTGIRARDYKPFVSGSKRSFHMILRKSSHVGAPTTFAGSGLGGPAPGTPHPTWEFIDHDVIRMYGTVNTFPATWDDIPVNVEVGKTYALGVFYDDATGICRYYINGRYVGQTGPLGYGASGKNSGAQIAYDTVTDPGFFEVGYRGDGAAFETFDGGMDEVMAWSREVTEAEFRKLAAAAGLLEQESLAIGGLDVNDGVRWRMRKFVNNPPPKRVEWLESADADGAIPATVPKHERMTVEAELEMVSPWDADNQYVEWKLPMDEALDRIGELLEKLQACEQLRPGQVIERIPAGSTKIRTTHAMIGEITNVPVENQGEMAGWFAENPTPVVAIKLECTPFWIGELVQGTVTGAGGASVPLHKQDLTVEGDVSALGIIRYADISGQARRHVEIGVDHTDDLARLYLLDSAVLETADYAGSQTTRTGNYNAGIIAATLINAPVTVCSTGQIDHVGSFLVRGRFYSTGTGTVEVRMDYRDGEEPFAEGEWQEIPEAGGFFDRVLGVADFTEEVDGTQSGEVRIVARSSTNSGDTVELDYLLLIPQVIYGVARAPSAADNIAAAEFDILDNFNQTAGNLSGKVADTGQAWSTHGGSATDLDIDTGVAKVRRSASGDADWGGRVGVIGNAAASQVVQAAVEFDSLAGSRRLGVVARHVGTDLNNFAMAYLRWSGAGTHQFWVIVRVGGVVVESQFIASAFFGVGGVPFDIRLATWADGRYEAWITFADAPFSGQPALSGEHPALATGGALATGKVGIYDESQAAATRHIDRLAAWYPVGDVAMTANRKFEVLHDRVRREGATANKWGRPPLYRGGYALLPPAGDAGLTTRVVAKARRSDVDVVAREDNVTDGATLRVDYYPRFLVPR